MSYIIIFYVRLYIFFFVIKGLKTGRLGMVYFFKIMSFEDYLISDRVFKILC